MAFIKNKMSKKSHSKICTLNKTIHEYAASSTAHGVAYIFEPNRWFVERLLWMILIGFAFIFSIYSTHKTYMEWQASPTITTINTTAYPIKSVEFPAITICSQGSAKNVMDAVILRQFELFLKARGIKAKKAKKVKRSTNNNEVSGAGSTPIHKTLSKEELATYLKQFLQETYPGAKKSPVEMVKMMAMPDIKPDTAIEASALITGDKSKCNKANGSSTGGNSGGSTTTGSNSSPGGTQPSAVITQQEIKNLVLAQRQSGKWEIGAPTGSFDKCPDGWIYNGKSKCFKKFYPPATFSDAQTTCKTATSVSGNIKLAAGDAELLKFQEDEDIIMLHYGLYTGKSELLNLGACGLVTTCDVEVWVDSFYRDWGHPTAIYNCDKPNRRDCSDDITKTPKEGWVYFTGVYGSQEDPSAVRFLSKGNDVNDQSHVDLRLEADWWLPSIQRNVICQTKAEIAIQESAPGGYALFSDRDTSSCGSSEMIPDFEMKDTDISTCATYCSQYASKCNYFSIRDPDKYCHLYSSCEEFSSRNPSWTISIYEKVDESEKEVSCILENGGDLSNVTKEETTTTQSATTLLPSSQSGGGNSPTRRKKRNEQGVTEAGSQTETETSKKNENSKNGCPKDFERLDDYLCLHLHKDADENGIQSSFEKSKKYCRDKDGSASLLQFVNAKEASKIWKWLEPYAPKVKGGDKTFPVAMDGRKVWKNSQCKLKPLPDLLGRAYYFSANKSELTEDEVVIETKGPTTIYLVVGRPKPDDGGGDEPAGGNKEDQPQGTGSQPQGKGSQPQGNVGGIVRRKRDYWMVNDGYEPYYTHYQQEDENDDINFGIIYGSENDIVSSMKDDLPQRGPGINETDDGFEISVNSNRENKIDRLKRSAELLGPATFAELEKNEWVKVEYDELITSCFESNQVWKKKVTRKDTVTITIPKLEGPPQEAIQGVVFVSGKIETFGYVKSGTCESNGMKSIHDEKSCKEASKHFEKQSNWVQVKPDDKGDTRPIGCTWHNDKLLQLWKKSSGKCNVDGYDGCFCIKNIVQKFDSPIWLNAEWNKTYRYLETNTKYDLNKVTQKKGMNVIEGNYVTLRRNGAQGDKARVRGNFDKPNSFDLFDSPAAARAMTICRSFPNLPMGIQTLNVILDPTKKTAREKKVEVAKQNYDKDFGQLELTKSYKQLFELLWYTRLPCFDVQGITSKERDEMSVIKRCYWRGVMVDCSSIFVTRSTDRGMCCSFNQENAEEIFKSTMYRNISSELQKRDKKMSFDKLQFARSGTKVEPKIYPGRDEGLQLILDAHTDKISSGSISDNFRGFHVVIDGKEKYPFTSKNGILIKSGQDNDVIISATRFEANKNIKGVAATKRNCYFPDEHPLKLYKLYSQANCLFQCKIEHVREQMSKTKIGTTKNGNGTRCVPWFYPVEDKYLYELCDPWQTAAFQKLFKEVSDDQCSQCLPDCTTTKYKTTISSAPFRGCDHTNIGVSPLCDLSTGKNMMMNPPIWKAALTNEYETYNGFELPDFIKNQKGVLSNIRSYVSKKDVKDLVFRAQREKALTYDALEQDITSVNFYFAESNIIQFTTFQRMTVIDFISSVGGIWGLFWGVSLTTIVELIYWGTLRWYRNC